MLFPMDLSSSRRHFEPEQNRHGCRICDAPHTSSLYGAVVCAACGAFFARTMKKGDGDRYKCPFPGRCLLHYTVKQRCRACRLKKCLEEGMRLRSKTPPTVSPPTEGNPSETVSLTRPSVIVRPTTSTAIQRPSVIVRRSPRRYDQAEQTSSASHADHKKDQAK